MDVAIDPEVRARFPGLEVAWVLVEGLAIEGPSTPLALAGLEEARERAKSTRTLEGLKDDPLFRAYRDFYWALGIDPTKTRPSGEALNRRALGDKPLPTINAFVDSYNSASLTTGVPIGAYNADALTGDLTLRAAREGEPFQALNEDTPRPLKGGEIILADARQIVNFYPYRDAWATRVSEATHRAVLVACGAPGIEAQVVDDAVNLAAQRVTRICGGSANAFVRPRP